MNRKDHTTDAVIAGDRESKSKSELLRISSGTLLNGRTELIIEHAGEEYRLRITSKGKLILTK